MKINEFMTALQTHLATQQPNHPNNAESILEVLFDAYNESSGFDNAAIKANFEKLYQLMNGKTLKEIDEITTLSVPSAGIMKRLDSLRGLRLECVLLVIFWHYESIENFE